MSKFSSFAEYPPRSLAGAEAALLTAWASLERFHDDLVLVGGLAVKYLTNPGVGLLPGPVTMDVDFGITLVAEAGGQYGSMADDLSGQGFKLNEKGRYVRQFETMPVFIDFLTEHPTATAGTIGVDGVPAGVFPGVARALATRRKVTVEGKDLFGAPQKAAVPVSNIGTLLVLKLNAFAGRQQAKDAYDVLLGVSRFADGPDAAIAAFQAEASAGNRGYARVVETLRRYFFEPGQSGPLRCAAFVLDGQPGIDDRPMRERQIVEQLVTIGRALAGAGRGERRANPHSPDRCWTAHGGIFRLDRFGPPCLVMACRTLYTTQPPLHRPRPPRRSPPHPSAGTNGLMIPHAWPRPEPTWSSPAPWSRATSAPSCISWRTEA